jgi:large subunit ribosomal protein L25
MNENVLKVDERQITGKQVKALRRSGLLPAVIYGRGLSPINISINAHQASKVIPFMTSSQLVVLELNGQKHTTLVRERQRHPVNGHLVHVDFNEISLTEKLQTEVEIAFIGDSPAVKNYNGVLVVNMESLEVEALPTDLPDRFTVDLSLLKNIGDTIRIRDIVVGKDIEVLTSEDEIIVIVTNPFAEAEPLPAQEPSLEPEVIERGKKGEEEF